MYLAFTAAVILIAWKRADWKNWQKYHTTMLFTALGNLLYNFIYHNHYLWQMKTDILPNYAVAEALLTFIVLPLTALLFLSNYPTTIKRQIIHNIRYIVVYIILEWIYHNLGRMEYQYGWNIWWSLAWDCMMFPMWALHYKKPLIAYGASLIIAVLMLILFPVKFM